MRADDRPQVCIGCREEFDRNNKEHAKAWTIWVNIVDTTTGHSAVSCSKHLEIKPDLKNPRYLQRPSSTSWWDVDLQRWF